MINQPLHCEMIFIQTTIDHSSYLMVETSPLIIACEVVYTDNHALTILATLWLTLHNQPLHYEMIFTQTTIDHSSYLMVDTSPLIVPGCVADIITMLCQLLASYSC